MDTRNRIRISIGIILLICMIGNASAATESMAVSFVGGDIHTEVWDLMTEGGGHYYILRYHPPGTLECNTETSSDCQVELESISPPAFPAGTINSSYTHFSNISKPNPGANDFYEEDFTPNEIGMWVISLWHSGSGTEGEEELIESYRLTSRVSVPIPEFPTIALPIAAILGLMFLLHSRRRKED